MCDARDAQMRASPLSSSDIPTGVDLTPLGRRLFGFQAWTPHDGDYHEGYNVRRERREAERVATLPEAERKLHEEMQRDLKVKAGERKK
jgi:hypothetical protein